MKALQRVGKDDLALVPYPKRLTWLDSPCSLSGAWTISVPEQDKMALLFTAERLQRLLLSEAGLTVELAIGLPESTRHCICLKRAERPMPGEGYDLIVEGPAITLIYGSPAGAFHGVSTLKQFLVQFGNELPGVHIEDEPDFGARGVMLDISRNKIPKLETILRLVDLFADLKMNQLQLYIEGFSFAYRSFPQVWEGGTPLTGEDILRLDRYCRERFIELVPNQNSFGHMTPWLFRKEFNSLAECSDGCTAPWGWYDKPICLNPLDPECLDLLEKTYGDLLPYFSSTWFNVGCDETFDLGQGKSKMACESLGKGRVYLDFLLKVHALVSRHGKRMMVWGDIIKQHPELIAELPQDVMALEWGYRADQPSADGCAKFRDAGVPYYVCPGTSSWNSITGLTENMMGNLLTAAVNGKEYGAVGYLVTDWGDCGHWQPLSASYPGFVYGAALCWAVEQNREIRIADYLDRFVYQDKAGKMGKLALELGNYYLQEKRTIYNGSGVFRTLYYHQLDDTNTDLNFLKLPDLISNDYQEVKQYLHRMSDELTRVNLQGDDARMLEAEWRVAVRLLLHGTELGLYKTDTPSDAGKRIARLERLQHDLASLLPWFRECWLLRNRRGGLEDSLTRLDSLKKQYSDAIAKLREVPIT